MIEFLHTGDKYNIFRLNLKDFTHKEEYYGYRRNPNSGFVLSDNYDELVQYNSLKNCPINDNPGLQPKQKLFITKECGFPPLLLSRLVSNGTCDLKRTVKSSAADWIVSDPIYKHADQVTWRQLDSCLPVCLYYDPNTKEVKLEYPLSKANARQDMLDAYQKMKEHYKINVFFGLYYLNIEQLSDYHSDSSKYITTTSVMKYVQGNCAKPTDEEWESLMATIQSTDAEQSKLGWDMLQYYDLSDRYFELFQILDKLNRGWDILLPSASARPASMKYVTEQLGLDYARFKQHSYYDELDMVVFDTLIKNPLSSPALKAKMYKRLPLSIAAHVQERYKNNFSLAGLIVSVVPEDDPAPLIDNPTYVESQILAEFQSDFTDKSYSSVVRCARKLLADYKLKFRVTRAYE